jgi:hypothetical protein
VRVGWREQGEAHAPEDDGTSNAVTTLQGFSAQENGAFRAETEERPNRHPEGGRPDDHL